MLYRNPALCIGVAGLLAACSTDTANEQPLPAGHSRLRIELATAALDRPIRADWEDPEATDGEMIHSAYIVMVSKNGDGGSASGDVVSEIIRMNATSETEKHFVKYVNVENGEYAFYSFANLPFTGEPSEAISCNGLTFRLGGTLPEGLADATYPATFNQLDLAPGIPMSNFETRSVSQNETVVLQLYRMAAKLRFAFTNKSGNAVRVKRVVLGNITPNATASAASPMYWLPRKDANGTLLTERPDGKAATADYVYYDAGEENGTEIATGAFVTLPYAYVNESVSDHATGQIPLTLFTERANGTDNSWKADTRHALISLQAIPRNAAVTVPVTLTDYALTVSADFYPPIGGYPSYDLTQHEDEFYATFNGAGDFVLTPQLFRLGANGAADTPIALNDHSQVTSVSLTVGGDTQIFSSVPQIDTVTGEILGTLSSTAGTASATLTLYLNIGTDVTQVYSRTIYIVAQ